MVDIGIIDLSRCFGITDGLYSIKLHASCGLFLLRVQSFNLRKNMKTTKTPLQSHLLPFIEYSTELPNPSLKTLVDKAKKQLPAQSYVSLHQRSEVGAMSNFITKQILNGFRPRWYVVLHLNNYRYDFESPEFDSDQAMVRDILFRQVYGNQWKKLPTHGKHKNRRARCFWTTEWGKKRDRPHLNLLLEDMKYPFNAQQSLEALFGWVIPAHVKCVWKKGYHVQPIHYETLDNLIRYICKESDIANSTFNPRLSDIYL